MTLLYIPFVKIVHALAMHEFGGYDFVKGNALKFGGDIQSTTIQKSTKFDFIFITFHPNDKSKAICVQPFIDNFKLTAEYAGALTYRACGIMMNTWNDSVQYQMLLSTLNFSDNSMVGLPREFIICCKGETIVTAPVANGFATTTTNILKLDLTNFL
jgi:hypothetical protein